MPEPAEAPDWLHEAMRAEATVAEELPSTDRIAPWGPVPAMPEPARVPDWLQEAMPAEAMIAGELPVAEEVVPQEPMQAVPEPAALDTLERPPWELSAGAGGADVDRWLAGLETELDTPFGSAEPVREGVPLLAVTSEAERVEPGGLAHAEIPDWLEALRPSAEIALEGEPAETEGILEGLRGVLPPDAVVRIPQAPDGMQPVERSDASLARAQVLQGLLAKPRTVPLPEERKEGARTGRRVQRVLVEVVIVAAVLVTLVAPFWTGELPSLVRLPDEVPAADRLYSVVESVRPDDIILVAFEYGPTEADELDLVAGPILRHVLERGGHISVVSTQPEGLAVAAKVLGAVAPETEASQYDMAYLLGRAVGVSQALLLEPDLIIVLSAWPAPLRWWVEQTQTLNAPPPIVAGISAALEPAVSPYLDVDAGQVAGVVSGLSGASYYERETLGEPQGSATERLNALAAGHVAVAVLMVLGAVFYTISGSRRRTR